MNNDCFEKEESDTCPLNIDIDFILKKLLEKEEKANLETMTVAELRDLAKSKEVKGYSTMKKAELLEALK